MESEHMGKSSHFMAEAIWAVFMPTTNPTISIFNHLELTVVL